ncbi:MAG: metal-dependent phosphohydrolase [Micromonosporaceae bacterium]
MNGLLDAWRTALPVSVPVGAAHRAGEQLLARWGEPQRHYHTVDHLAAVLHVVDEHHHLAADPDVVRLAAWFHDAVYNPHRVDNEEASALLAEATLPELHVGPARVAEVARLVRLTAGHDPAPGDHNGGLLTDADLAILASRPEVYRAYTVAVRREYAHVPDTAFAAGRGAVLENLLSLPRLYHCRQLRERWEATARHNLATELTLLRTTHPCA